MGEPNVDITRVMIAAQKSSVSFEALTQVRNRVVKAYEDVMNMPV
jgi:flagellar hook-basal body complex protein FliE